MGKKEYILALPIPVAARPEKEPEKPEMCEVRLPEWAGDLGIDGCLLVPRWAAGKGGWQQTDWLGSMFWLMNCEAERAYEAIHGPIHSYSIRLRDWDGRLWEHAWVNRMALLLRRWAAYIQQQPEDILFGPMPAAEIWVTHDVDAVNKTAAIRLKQAAFCLFNGLRYLGVGRISAAAGKAGQALGFLCGKREDYHRLIEDIASLEGKFAIRSIFFVYAGGKQRKNPLSAWLIDPHYDIKTGRLKDIIRKLTEDGWNVGLHQSYHNWQDCRDMTVEKGRLEEALGVPVTMCRQHWLRFSWQDTWRAQAAAGMAVDFTLGFNDRAGFRNSAALMMRPCMQATRETLNITSVPMVIMDSHLYDYALGGETAGTARMKKVIDEVFAVRGQASVIWHPHTLSKDYGWGQGFEDLIRLIGEKV